MRMLPGVSVDALVDSHQPAWCCPHFFFKPAVTYVFMATAVLEGQLRVGMVYTEQVGYARCRMLGAMLEKDHVRSSQLVRSRLELLTAAGS